MFENLADAWKAYEDAAKTIKDATTTKNEALEYIRANMPEELRPVEIDSSPTKKGKRGKGLTVSKDDKATIKGLVVPILKKHPKSTGPKLLELVQEQAKPIKFNTQHFDQIRTELYKEQKIKKEGTSSRNAVWSVA